MTRIGTMNLTPVTPSPPREERVGKRFPRKTSPIESLNLRSEEVFSLSSSGGEGWGEEALFVSFRFVERRPLLSPLHFEVHGEEPVLSDCIYKLSQRQMLRL